MVSENIDFCPFCKCLLPLGPAFYCPKCGKQLTENYNNRPFFKHESNNTKVQNFFKNDKYTIKTTNNDEYYSNENNDSNNEEKTQLSSLEKYNKDIKLDLFLSNLNDSYKEYSFSLYPQIIEKMNLSVENSELSVNKIIKKCQLNDILKFLDEFIIDSNEEYSKIIFLNNVFKLMSVLDVINLSKKYRVSVSSTKLSMIKDFVNEFSFRELINILEQSNIPIDYYSFYKDLVFHNYITVLEQIYRLDSEMLDLFSKKLLANAYSNEEKIKCIVNNFEDKFLLSYEVLTEKSFE